MLSTLTIIFCMGLAIALLSIMLASMPLENNRLLFQRRVKAYFTLMMSLMCVLLISGGLFGIKRISSDNYNEELKKEITLSATRVAELEKVSPLVTDKLKEQIDSMIKEEKETLQVLNEPKEDKSTRISNYFKDMSIIISVLFSVNFFYFRSRKKRVKKEEQRQKEYSLDKINEHINDDLFTFKALMTLNRGVKCFYLYQDLAFCENNTNNFRWFYEENDKNKYIDFALEAETVEVKLIDLLDEVQSETISYKEFSEKYLHVVKKLSELAMILEEKNKDTVLENKDLLSKIIKDKTGSEIDRIQELLSEYPEGEDLLAEIRSKEKIKEKLRS